MSTHDRKVTRRKFIQTAAVAGGVAAVPCLVPAKALGRNGAVPASERIVAAGIGIGGRGQGDVGWMMGEPDVQFVAVCDARKTRREAVKKMVDAHNGNNDCKTYPDIREFLAQRTDIDAVLIATGDRWHALASILAMRAGKDVYSEKPSSMTIAEGQAVVETARRYGRIYQTGTQRLSEANFVFCIEIGPQRPLGQGAYDLRPHRAVGRGRDEARMAAPRSPNRPRTRSIGTCGSGRVPGGRTTPRTSAAAGAATTTSTRAASASGARTRSPRPRRASTP